MLAKTHSVPQMLTRKLENRGLKPGSDTAETLQVNWIKSATKRTKTAMPHSGERIAKTLDRKVLYKTKC